MSIRIDERAVKAAEAPAKGAVSIWDSELKGFGLRIFAPTHRHPEGARSFFVNYRVAGVERRHTIGDFPRWSALGACPDSVRLKATCGYRRVWPWIWPACAVWLGSGGGEVGGGQTPPLGELEHVVGEADEAPFVGDLVEPAHQELTEAAGLLDLPEHRLGQLLA